MATSDVIRKQGRYTPKPSCRPTSSYERCAFIFSMLTNLPLSIGGVLVYVARADLTSYSMERERSFIGRVEAPNDAHPT